MVLLLPLTRSRRPAVSQSEMAGTTESAGCEEKGLKNAVEAIGAEG